MSVNEHVMMSSDQRSSLCHPANLLNDEYLTARAIHTEKSANYEKFTRASIKFQAISRISRNCKHPTHKHSYLFTFFVHCLYVFMFHRSSGILLHVPTHMHRSGRERRTIEP